MGTLYAQHKKAAACSFIEKKKVLLILKHFFKAPKETVYQFCTQVPARKDYLLWRPPCI